MIWIYMQTFVIRVNFSYSKLAALNSWQISSQCFFALLHKLLCRVVLASRNFFSLTYAHGKVLCHEAFFDCLNDWALQSFAEVQKWTIIVKLSSVHQTSGPSKDRGNWVCWSLLAFLPLSVMSGHCTMSCFSFNTAIRWNQNTSHQSKRSVSLSDNIWLDITIVVLASPYKCSVTLDAISNHIINKSVFVP